MQTVAGARVVEYPDGAVVFDPVAGAVRLLPRESLLILDFLQRLISTGIVERDRLVDALLAELSDDSEPLDAAARERLTVWVDLARHVFC